MFELRPVFKILLLAIPAIGGVLVLINLLRLNQLSELKGGLKKGVRFLPLILAISILSGAGCFLYMRSGEPYKGSFKISYTYPKASKGLTPNSTTLDVNEILSDEVLNEAIQADPSGKLTAEDIRNTLSISPIRQQSDVSVDRLYVSTEYTVSYNALEGTTHLDKKELMEGTAEAYYDYFVARYGRKTNVLENDLSELSDLDYLDVNTYLYREATALIEYMGMCNGENADFVSEKTNESFTSVRDKARNFRDVSLERFKSYVLKYGISKDSNQYVSRLNFENRLTNVDYMKNLASYGVRLSAIERYDGDIIRSVLVPTRDDDGEFYQSRTKIGTDYFANEANRFLRSATNNQLSIETNNYYIERIASANGGSSYRESADEMVNELKAELISIFELASETVKDYDAQVSNGYISFTFQEENAYASSNIKKTILYFAGVFFVMSALIITWPASRRRPKAGPSLMFEK